jgi:hypothetical protein
MTRRRKTNEGDQAGATKTTATVEEDKAKTGKVIMVSETGQFSFFFGKCIICFAVMPFFAIIPISCVIPMYNFAVVPIVFVVVQFVLQL